jgi:hypothetical protein
MSFTDIFVEKARQRIWERLPMSNVLRERKPLTEDDAPEIKKDEAYVTLRMRQMYLKNIRVLWRKYYPLLHGYVSYAGQEEHVIAGPSQLTQLGDANLDRVIVLNQRLGGPIAYQGGELTMLTGLYSVPGEDSAKALVETLSNVAALPGLALGSVTQIANIVKSGVESILKLNESRLELGVKDSFYSNKPLRAGFYIAMDASLSDVDFSQLWLDGGLKFGRDPFQAKSFDKHDYMVIEIERTVTRDDWAALPGFKTVQDKFNAIMADGATDSTEKRNRLKAVWPEFYSLLDTSTGLITADKKKIADGVKARLTTQLEAGSNPFESRSIGGRKITVNPMGFDFLDVDEVSGDGRAFSAAGF